jgi:hypothetical protein
LEEELKGAAYRKVLPPFFMLSLQDTCNAIDGNDLHTDMLVNYANQVIGNSHGDTASKSDSKSTCIKLTLRDFAAFHQIWPELAMSRRNLVAMVLVVIFGCAYALYQLDFPNIVVHRASWFCS